MPLRAHTLVPYAIQNNSGPIQSILHATTPNDRCDNHNHQCAMRSKPKSASRNISSTDTLRGSSFGCPRKLCELYYGGLGSFLSTANVFDCPVTPMPHSAMVCTTFRCLIAPTLLVVRSDCCEEKTLAHLSNFLMTFLLRRGLMKAAVAHKTFLSPLLLLCTIPVLASAMWLGKDMYDMTFESTVCHTTCSSLSSRFCLHGRALRLSPPTNWVTRPMDDSQP